MAPPALPGPGVEARSLLRLVVCGSVDDGKSTLVGRLLHDVGAVDGGRMAALAAESALYGTCGDGPDFALLLDGLGAEREQGITVDVAWRTFATPLRSFIIADTPGHEHYTRNMATGASTCDLAVILVDAGMGLTVQTRRHTTIARLLGIRQMIVAVNKMDRAGRDQGVFQRIDQDFRTLAASLDIASCQVIPVVATTGENLAVPAPLMGWYAGPTLLEALEQAPGTGGTELAAPFRMPVQWVGRPGGQTRLQCGQIAAGTVAPGDRLLVLPGGQSTTVARIAPPGDGPDLACGVAGQSVALELAAPVDCSRGCMLVAAGAPPQLADRLEATLIWLDPAALVPGQAYALKLATQTTGARVLAPRHRLDVDTQARVPATTLGLNEIGVCEILCDGPLVHEPYSVSRQLGGFILIDRATHATVAAGLIERALPRTANLHWQTLDVTDQARAQLMGQRPAVIWLTGISGAGKTTIANLLDRRLHAGGYRTALLDGDNLRHGLCDDLGFTAADRIENIRRVGEVARLMCEAGLITICACISPFASGRAAARARAPEGRFIEVHVHASVATAEARDPKGLYRKARAASLTDFTGIDSTYEPPSAPEVFVDTDRLTPQQAVEQIWQHLLALPGGLAAGDHPS